MSESRKRSRKSKLVVRTDDDDFDETENTVLQKTPTLLQPKTKTLDHTYSRPNVSPAPTSFELSVQVEVEEFDESIMNTDGEDANTANIIPGPSVITRKPRGVSLIRVLQVNLERMYKIANHITWSSTNPADKFFGIEIKNLWGRFIKPDEDVDPHEELLQKGLCNWGMINGRSWKESPMFYQCLICKLAWWRLEPFRTHIRTHDPDTLKVYHQENYHETFIVASNTVIKLPEYIKCEGDCYRCGNAFDYHVNTPHHQYTCLDCYENLPTCAMLKHHQAVCLRTLSIAQVPKEQCTICFCRFRTVKLLEKHMSTAHLVRSDDPIQVSIKTCTTCKKRYHNFHMHVCIKSSLNASCPHCYRKFSTKMLCEFHTATGDTDAKCTICDTVLRRRCMETEHMLTHTDQYQMAYKCINPQCTPTTLFLDEKSVRLHKVLHHKQKFDKRRTYCEMVVIPRKIVSSESIRQLNYDVVPQGTAISKGSSKNIEAIEKIKPPKAVTKSNNQQTGKKITQEDFNIKQVMDSLPTDAGSQDQDYAAMDYEQMLTNVFKVSDSVRNAKPIFSSNEINATEIKIEPCEEIDFETQIDILENPIKIKDEPIEFPMEQCDIEEMCLNDALKDSIDIKTEPLDYEMDNIYDTNVSAIKMEPEELKMESADIKKELINPMDKKSLIEATDIKIMDTYSESLSTDETPIVPAKKKKKPAKIVVKTFKNNKCLVKRNIRSNQIKAYYIFKQDSNLEQKLQKYKNCSQKKLTQNVEADQNSTQNAEIDQNAKLEQNELTQNAKLEQNELTQNAKLEQNELTQNAKLEQNELTQNAKLEQNELTQNAKLEQNESTQTDKTEPNESTQNAKVEDANTCQTESKQNTDRRKLKKNLKLQRKLIKIRPNGFKLKRLRLDENGIRQVKIYTCNKCGYSNRHKQYRIHVNSDCMKSFVDTTKSAIYKCTKCNTSYPTMKMYTTHFPKHGYAILECPVCSVKFESLKELLQHFPKHYRQSFINCFLINSAEEVSTKKQQMCNVCRQMVPPEHSFSHWESHLKLNPVIKLEPNVEDDSDKGSKIVRKRALAPPVMAVALQQLRSVLHEKECMVCGRMFHRRYDCKRHLIEHLLLDAHSKRVDTDTNVFRCQICQEQFQRAEFYKFHMREHGALPVYRCDLCNKTFSDSSNFAKHKKIHSLKVLICDICQKKFHAKTSLVRHIMMHQVTEPIKCEHCDRLFYATSHYRRHVKVSHMPVRFRCALCDMYFDTLRLKWDHAWAVHRERKHQANCPMCPKEYRRFVDVKRHARNIHGTELTFFNIEDGSADAKSKTKVFCKIKKKYGETILVPTDYINFQK